MYNGNLGTIGGQAPARNLSTPLDMMHQKRRKGERKKGLAHHIVCLNLNNSFNEYEFDC